MCVCSLMNLDPFPNKYYPEAYPKNILAGVKMCCSGSKTKKKKIQINTKIDRFVSF